MAPVTFHLLSLRSSSEADSFVSSLKALPQAQRPLWLGHFHHWFHEPHYSTGALLGEDSHVTKWDYLLVGDVPSEVDSYIAKRWSIKGDSPDDMPSLNARDSVVLPEAILPDGWSADDYSGLDASVPPTDISLTIDEIARPLGSERSSNGIPLRDFVRSFGTTHTGPVVMFNILSYLPNKRSVYFDGYIAGFGEKMGPMFGGAPIQVGWGVTEWSSQAEETEEDGGWEDVAMVWYPSVWHFAKMIDDPVYADLDRRFKPISLRDNPLACCTEIEL